MRYVSGFANSQDGSLLIGVDDNGVVVGVENAKKLLENLPNKIVSTTGVIPEVSLLEENGKEYIKNQYRGEQYARHVQRTPVSQIRKHTAGNGRYGCPEFPSGQDGNLVGCAGH